MSATPAERNLAAELRAVEEGHRALLDGDALRVVSDTRAGVAYRVRPRAQGDLLVVECDCPYGQARAAGRDPVRPGVLGCKHAAVVARRLERHRLAVCRPSDGLWGVTPLAASLAVPVHDGAVERIEGVLWATCACGWRVNVAGTEAYAEKVARDHVAGKVDRPSARAMLECM